MYVSGVGFLATELDRIKFFFASVPLSFYTIFAVMGTLLLSVIRHLFRKASKRNVKRSRSTGNLDAPEANPLGAKLEASDVPDSYQSHVIDFFTGGIINGVTIGICLYGIP